jgi:hypothetical protein
VDSTLDDGGDFKKARGFLLTYSAVILALWFFGANLTAFKLMGTEIRLEHRTNSVWLVLACLNIYFWFRFIQHIPRGGFRFDDGMNQIYDDSLQKAAAWRKHFELRKRVKAVHTEKHAPHEKTKFTRGSAYLTCYERLREDRRDQPEGEITLHDYSRENRTEMRVSAYYHYTMNGEWRTFGDHVHIANYTPSKPFSWTIKAYALLKGAFIAPWFTDHIAPLLVGIFSTSVAFWNWWQVNHPNIMG